LVDSLVVSGNRLLVRAFLLELRDIGAGHEGVAARTSEHDYADAFVVAEIIEESARRLPHFERYRILPLGIV